MRRSRLLLLFTLLICTFVVLSTIVLSYQQTEKSVFVQDRDVVIFTDPNCLECGKYIDNTLLPLLNEHGLVNRRTIDITEGNGRATYNTFIDKYKIPLKLKSKPMVCIKEKFITSGYVPGERLHDFFNQMENYSKKLLIRYDNSGIFYSDTQYCMWDIEGEPQTYALTTPVKTYIDWIMTHPGTQAPPEPDAIDLLPLVIISGLIDGINPCAFAVILFLISFLFSVKMESDEIFNAGMCYTVVVFTVYFLVGLALFDVLRVSGIQQYVLLAGAIAIIAFGLINVRDSLKKTGDPIIKIPERSKKHIVKIAKNASIPAAIGLGVFVSLTEFVCTGSIYVVVVSLLSSGTTYLQGIGLLVIYNLMFVLPLVVIVVLASNRMIAEWMIKWRDNEKKRIRLSLGIGMVFLGVWTFAIRYSTVSPLAMIFMYVITAILIFDLVYAIIIFIGIQKKHSTNRAI